MKCSKKTEETIREIIFGAIAIFTLGFMTREIIIGFMDDFTGSLINTAILIAILFSLAFLSWLMGVFDFCSNSDEEDVDSTGDTVVYVDADGEIQYDKRD